MAKHYPAAQWRAWFVEFDQSDVTVGEFCQSVGVSVQSYYKWRKRLKQLDVDSATSQADNRSFVPVSITAAKVEIEFPGGAMARITNDADSLRPARYKK